MVLALGMPQHIPNTQGREIARTAECKYRSALGVDESRLEFWLPHLSGLYNDAVPPTIGGNCSRVNFPASQRGVGPGKRGNRTTEIPPYPPVSLGCEIVYGSTSQDLVPVGGPARVRNTNGISVTASIGTTWTCWCCENSSAVMGGWSASRAPCERRLGSRSVRRRSQRIRRG
jgi:hypothetical protein